MRHTLYVFRLHRRGLVLLVAGSAVFTVLVFAAGWLSGVSSGFKLAGQSLPQGLGKPAVPTADVAGKLAALKPPMPQAPAPKPVAPAPAPSQAPAQAPAESAPPKAASAPPAEPVQVAEATAAEPAPAPEGEAPAPAAAGPSLLPARTFSLQVGTFVVEDNAKTLLASLTERGFEAHIVKSDAGSERVLYRVVIGSYASRREASEAATQFREEERQPAFVVEARMPKAGQQG
ncbi:MAG: SPOR domain-containing protein [Thermoanaerobaculia bacterium]